MKKLTFILGLCSSVAMIVANGDDTAPLVRGSRLKCATSSAFSRPVSNIRGADLAKQEQIERKIKWEFFRNDANNCDSCENQLLLALKRKANTNLLVPVHPTVRPQTRSATQTPWSFVIRGREQQFNRAVESRTVFNKELKKRLTSVDPTTIPVADEGIDLGDCCCCIPYMQTAVKWVQSVWYTNQIDRRNKKGLGE